MSTKLFVSAILKFTLGVILVGLLVFLPAGTIKFPGGILFMAILFVPMFLAGIVMMIKKPHFFKAVLMPRKKKRTRAL